MKKKLIIIIVTIAVLCVGSIWGFKYINSSANTKTETLVLTGTVVDVGINNFIILDDATKMEYSVNYDNFDFLVGDRVKVYSKEPVLEVYPAIVKASKIEIIEKYTELNSIIEPDIPNNNQENENLNKSIDDSSVVSKTKGDVLGFFQSVDKELDKKNVGESVKESFIIIIDFLFYDGEIYGSKFNDLTEAIKLKVLKIGASIDKKIDTVFPGYKESISGNVNRIYLGIKEKIIEKYLDITVNVCRKDQSICDQAKADFRDMKNSFNLTWDFITGLAKKSLGKLSDWYIIWKDN